MLENPLYLGIQINPQQAQRDKCTYTFHSKVEVKMVKRKQKENLESCHLSLDSSQPLTDWYCYMVAITPKMK